MNPVSFKKKKKKPQTPIGLTHPEGLASIVNFVLYTRVSMMMESKTYARG